MRFKKSAVILVGITLFCSTLLTLKRFAKEAESEPNAVKESALSTLNLSPIGAERRNPPYKAEGIDINTDKPWPWAKACPDTDSAKREEFYEDALRHVYATVPWEEKQDPYNFVAEQAQEYVGVYTEHGTEERVLPRMGGTLPQAVAELLEKVNQSSAKIDVDVEEVARQRIELIEEYFGADQQRWMQWDLSGFY